MPYPQVIQFETRALEAEARARLAHERLAAHASKRAPRGRRRFMEWLPFPRSRAGAKSTSLSQLNASECEQ